MERSKVLESNRSQLKKTTLDTTSNQETSDVFNSSVIGEHGQNV